MAKDPAFLFYPGDWLGGTMGMTIEQKGAYMELLIFQFNNGPFTEAQAKQVLSICFARVWQVLSTKFVKNGDLYENRRLSDEVEKRKKFSESRRANAKGVQSTSKAYAKHMENENKDIVIHTDKAFNSEFAKILNKKYKHGPDRGMEGTGQDVDSLVIQLRSMAYSDNDMLNQAKAMKQYYSAQDWPMPTNYIKLLTSLTENDWVEKIKELNPETKTNAKYTNRPADPDTIGTSAPGSLE